MEDSFRHKGLRKKLVDSLRKKGILNEMVLGAIEKVPRHLFMYSSFLDPTLMYSSAIYPNKESSLVDAQRNKLDVICKKLGLKPTDTVVEI